MLNNTTRVMSANSRLQKAPQDKQPFFSTNKLQGKKKNKNERKIGRAGHID